jgi:hypothetical protein
LVRIGLCARGPDWHGKKNTQADLRSSLAGDDPCLQRAGARLFQVLGVGSWGRQVQKEWTPRSLTPIAKVLN